jgi:hypothetical protein
VFAVIAAGKHGEYADKPNADSADAGERATFAADISFGMAGLFGLAAVALYFLPDEPSPSATSALKSGVFRF